MAYWVSIRDSSTGKEKTFVSYAGSESKARAEAEKRGLKIAEIFPVSSDTLPSELENHDRLTPSPRVAFQVLCLTVGQVVSILVCVAIIPLSLTTFITRTAQHVDIWFAGFIAAGLIFCTSVAIFTVFSYVKQQLK